MNTQPIQTSSHIGTLPDAPRHFDILPWLSEEEIHLWGVAMLSTGQAMNSPVGRSLGEDGLEHWKKVTAHSQEESGEDNMDKQPPKSAYQRRHHALLPHDSAHVEGLAGGIGRPELQNRRLDSRASPWKYQRREAAFCHSVVFEEE